MIFTVGCIVFLLMYDIPFLNRHAKNSLQDFHEDTLYIKETIDIYSEQFQ